MLPSSSSWRHISGDCVEDFCVANHTNQDRFLHVASFRDPEVCGPSRNAGSMRARILEGQHCILPAAGHPLTQPTHPASSASSSSTAAAMADRVYPAAKPTPPPAMTNGGEGSAAPLKAPQMYQRPIYRPQGPPKSRRGRSCRCSFCCCFCWALLALLLLAVVAGAAGGVFYLLYRPQRPSFTVSSVRLTSFNLSSSATAPVLTDSIQLTVTAKNPNKKLVYTYDDFSFSAATTANAVPLGDATVPGFTHQAGNTTIFTATIAAAAVTVDPSGAGSDLKKSGAFSVSVDADTRAGVKVGSLKTKKMNIQVRCDGIKITPPSPPPPAPKKVKGKNGTALAPAPAPAALDGAETTPTTVSVTPHSCKVRVRVKIGRWTF